MTYPTIMPARAKIAKSITMLDHLHFVESPTRVLATLQGSLHNCHCGRGVVAFVGKLLDHAAGVCGGDE